MADDTCPNCKKPLSERDRQRLNASGPDWTGPSEEERRQRNRRCGRGIILTICGVGLLALSPVVFFRLAPPDPQLSGAARDSLIKTACFLSGFLLVVGWIVIEIGLVKTGCPRILQILPRVLIYLYILLGFAYLAFVGLFFTGSWP